jgi:hypothetical protein
MKTVAIELAELLVLPRWIFSAESPVEVYFSLPRQGVSLLRLAW